MSSDRLQMWFSFGIFLLLLNLQNNILFEKDSVCFEREEECDDDDDEYKRKEEIFLLVFLVMK